MLKAVVFDYNGTLVDDLDYHVESYWRAGRNMGLDVDRRTIAEHISMPPSEKRTLYYGTISDQTWTRLFDLKAKYYFELAADGDLLFPDAAEVLVQLADRYTLAIISNTVRAMFERLFPSYLAALFQFTLFFDEMAVPKPAPDALTGLIKMLGCDAGECCYVGDAVADVRMAKDAGTSMVAVTTGDADRRELEVAGADRVISSLVELGPALTELV